MCLVFVCLVFVYKYVLGRSRCLGSRGTTRFWGKSQGPTVFLWKSLGEEGRKECEEVIHTHRDDDDDDDDVFYLFLQKQENRSQAPYIPLGRYVPYEAV